MRTVVQNSYGSPEVLEVVELPTPTPGPEQVLVAVRAAALNPVDLAMRAGGMAAAIGEPFPLGLGWDVAGTVEAVGEGVTRWSVGDEVVGLRDEFVGPTGAVASHVVLPADAVATTPAGVSPEAAATFPLNTLTAHQALDLLRLEPGRSVVVTGAAGGVGDYLVALAARRGLRVIGVARADDEAGVRANGATDFATGSEIGQAVRALLPEGADGLVDAAQVGQTALAAVRDGGSFVAVSDPSEPPAERDITVATVHVHHDAEQQAELVRLVESGVLRLRVAATYSLDDVAKAHEAAAQPGLRGRVVVTA
ncbi:MAG TPA: NADP-dependent oxidoreductase [Nocardioides sp.]|nr:NADP-dependent oxidoreductase [Nocardioides sp.]